MHLYQLQSSRQTLAEGLAEYYAAYPGLKRGPGLSAEAQGFFHRHDVIHVLYGCGVSLQDEAVVKVSHALQLQTGIFRCG